jgi:hypothetical protein
MQAEDEEVIVNVEIERDEPEEQAGNNKGRRATTAPYSQVTPTT